MPFKVGHNRPLLGEEEKAAVSRVLESDWLVAGSETQSLETQLANYIGKDYAIAVNSGLSALHLALLSLGVGSGDEVVLPSYTCIALLHAVRYVGATPVVVDIEEGGFGLDPVIVEAHIGTRTKAIIAPHTFGLPAAVEELQSFGVPVIEDCAISLGTTTDARSLGSLGDVSIFSFYATKMITSGQGGALLTDSKEMFDELTDLLAHTRRHSYREAYNYRMTDVAAAIAVVQLGRLDDFIVRRKMIAQAYSEVLVEHKDITTYPLNNTGGYNYYRYILQFPNIKTRDKALGELRKASIEAIVPIQEYEVLHRQLGLKNEAFMATEKALATTLSLPLYPAMSDADVEYVVKSLQKVL